MISSAKSDECVVHMDTISTEVLACTLSELGQGFGLLKYFRELTEGSAGLEKRGLAKYLGVSERCFKVILVAKSIRVISSEKRWCSRRSGILPEAI